MHNNVVFRVEESSTGSVNTQYYVRSAGQFIYGKQNFFNGAIGIVPKSLDKYKSTKDIPAFDICENVDVQLLYQYMTRLEIYKTQKMICTRIGSKKFHVNDFYNMKMFLLDISEQNKISDFLNILNIIISFHQRE